MPYVFTEQGIAMLSAVLRSDIAVQTSIKIMDAFVEMRRFLASNALMFEKINEMELKQLAFQRSSEEKFDKIFHYISEHEESSQKIFHDRFMIIDGIHAYHIGASIKDAGKKCFDISLIEDTRIVKDILERLNLESEEADKE